MYSQITVLGFVGQDAVVRGEGDEQYITFSVASGKDENTTWYNVSTNRNVELYSDLVKKGAPILVSGELRLRKYETKDGKDGQSLDIRNPTIRVVNPR